MGKWGVVSRSQVIALLDPSEPWGSCRSLRGWDKRQVCPVGLVRPTDNAWRAMEADAEQYGLREDVGPYVESVFRSIRAAKAEAQLDAGRRRAEEARQKAEEARKHGHRR